LAFEDRSWEIALIGLRFRKCLNERLFTSYRHARDSIEESRIDDNLNRPQTGLKGPRMTSLQTGPQRTTA
jgi:putative transposase